MVGLYMETERNTKTQFWFQIETQINKRTHSVALNGNRKKREIVVLVLDSNKNKQTHTQYSCDRNTKKNEMVVWF